jgi:hypothetical protein
VLAGLGEASSLFEASTTLGNARELLVALYLEDHLPRRLLIERGELIDEAGNRSGQCDIILADGNIGWRRSGGQSLIPAEAAIAAIEVKSSLSGGNLDDALAKVARIKRLRRGQHSGLHHIDTSNVSRIEIPPRRVMCIVIAFSSPSLNHVYERIVDNPLLYEGNYLERGPEIVVLLGKGFVYKDDGHFMQVTRGPISAAVLAEDAIPVAGQSGLRAMTLDLQTHLQRYGLLSWEAYY